MRKLDLENVFAQKLARCSLCRNCVAAQLFTLAAIGYDEE